MVRGGCVYILTNFKRTTLYVGVTSDLVSRVLEHNSKKYPRSFTARYNLQILVYFESFSTINEAISMEKYIKGKSRKWKEDLINQQNPEWIDLWEEIKDCEKDSSVTLFPQNDDNEYVTQSVSEESNT